MNRWKRNVIRLSVIGFAILVIIGGVSITNASENNHTLPQFKKTTKLPNFDLKDAVLVATLEKSPEKDVEESNIFHLEKGKEIVVVIENQGEKAIDYWISEPGSEIAKTYNSVGPNSSITQRVPDLKEGEYVLKMGCISPENGSQGVGKVYIVN